MSDLAIGISVYNKFEDVKILVDLIRRNWKGKFFISVCSSHADPFSQLKNESIDELLTTEPIPFDPKVHKTAIQQRIHLFSRVNDSIRKVCQSCTTSGAEYTMHIHADALPLSWPAIQNLLLKMKEQKKKFLGLGQGFGFYCEEAPVGALDDMFFIVDNKHARDNHLWEFDLLDALPHKLSCHGWLPLLVITKVGLKRFLLLSDYDEFVHWDGRMVDQSPLNSSVPMYFHPKYKFLHIHEAAFTNNLGLKLKAHYLAKSENSKGPAIEAFLKKWLLDEEDLFQQLKDEEERLINFYKNRGLERLARNSWGRVFSQWQKHMEEYTSQNTPGKFKWLISKHAAQIKRALRGRIFDKHLLGNKRFQTYHPDIIWPSHLSEVYEKNLIMDRSQVPELTEFPFN